MTQTSPRANTSKRKLLALLHTYSLRFQEQRDILLQERDKLLDACEAVATRMRDDYRSDECLGTGSRDAIKILSDEPRWTIS